MSPDEAFLRRLAAEVDRELGHLSQLRRDAASAPRDDDTFTLRARGSILHDVYNGVERIFVRIAEELDGGTPQGEPSHRQLVATMSLDVPGVRPAVIDTELEHALVDFLRFRNLFRNLYGSFLEAERMRPLEDRLPGVVEAFERQVGEFLAWMVGADRHQA